MRRACLYVDGPHLEEHVVRRRIDRAAFVTTR
jgi:hypothetical protein